MLKKLAFGGVGLVLLATPLITSALTVQERIQLLQEQLQSLLAIISTLGSSSSDSSSGGGVSGGGSGSCVVLVEGLHRGSSGSAVTNLQLFLQSTSSPSTSTPYFNVEATGIFGQITENALKQFQTDNGLTSNGTVASSTRTKVAALTGCTATDSGATGGSSSRAFIATPASGAAPLRVSFTFLTNLAEGVYKVVFGDEQASGDIISCPQGGTCPVRTINVSHSYTSAGNYTAKLVVPMHDECEGSVCTLLAETTLATAVISVTAPSGDVPAGDWETECISLQNDLRVGSRDAFTNGEVSILQVFLQSTNSPVTGLPYLLSAPTGYFGPMTKLAVKQFQRDNGLPSTGLVRKLTRAAIEELTCGSEEGEDDSTSANVASVSGSVSGNTVNVTWANLPGNVYIHLIESNNQELFVERLYTLASEYSGSHAIPSVPSGRYFLRVTRNGQRNGPLIAESSRFEVGGTAQTCNQSFRNAEFQTCSTGAFAARFGQNCDWELCPYGGGSGNAALRPVITVNGVGGTGNPPDMNIAAGATAHVSWSVVPAGTTCTTSDGVTTDRNVPLSYTGDIGPYTSTRTFSMTCTNSNGQASKTLRINVGTATTGDSGTGGGTGTDTATTATAPKITSFTAAATTLASGSSTNGSTNLSWAVTPADSVCWIKKDAGNDTSVPVNNSNYQTGPLTADTKYTLTCHPSGKPELPASKEVAIKVVSATFTANGAHSVSAQIDDPINYAWDSKNADSFDANYTSDRCGSASWKPFLEGLRTPGYTLSYSGNSAKGTRTDKVHGNQAGCTYTITYTARNTASGVSASDKVTEVMGTYMSVTDGGE